MRKITRNIKRKVAVFALALTVMNGLPAAVPKVEAAASVSVTSASYGLSEELMEKAINICFSPIYYADMYPDLKQVYGYDYDALLNHWLRTGVREGRAASPIFDVRFYLSYHPDLKQAFGSDYTLAFSHFVQYGLNELRASSPYYSGAFYKQYYKDIANLNGYDLALHYLTYGFGERRLANPFSNRLSGWEKDSFVPRNAGDYFNNTNFRFPLSSYTRISSDYGMRIHPTQKKEQFHDGVDFAAPKGTAILAALGGKVSAAAYSPTMGYYVTIDHGSGLSTTYMHASALYVKKGETVSRGQTIAAVGSTGRSTGNHLHFMVKLNGKSVSPWKYLRK